MPCRRRDWTDKDNLSYAISISNGTFAWGRGKDDSPILKGINMTLDEGQLVAVVGRVGEGKSSLISAILGEMEKISGRVNVKGSVAYVAQQAWIQNATVRSNILFGKELNQEKYDAVLEACALLPDLEILTAGDQTEIGEKGINLSGGQKQRVSLARAVYSDSDIYLLDDPLSAVDSHVGKHIFKKVISDSGLLRGKTRILVTHGVHWLPDVNNIVVLINGSISEMGSYEELMSHNAAFAQFLKQHLLQENGDNSDSDPELEKVKAKIVQRLGSLSGDDDIAKMVLDGGVASGPDGASFELKGTKPRRRRQSSVKSPDKTQLTKSVDKGAAANDKTPAQKPSGTLVEKETSQVGKVSLNVFLAYGRALGIILLSVAIFFFAMYMVISVLSSVWLSVWTEDPLLKNASIPITSPEYVHQRDMYLGVYGAMGLLQVAFVLIYSINVAICSVRASRVMHFNMLKNILRSPMAFFETTPTGRILNRFSHDVETVDDTLPTLFRSWVNTTLTVISTFVVISYSTPIFLVMVLPLALLYYFIQRFYIPTSRQLQRIESTTRSPIYVHFSETVTGASTIRAYNVQRRFITTSMQHVDHNLVFYFSSIASNRWIGIRLELIGAFIVLSAALFAVLSRGNVNSGVVGLSITYALQITQSLSWMVRMTSDLETNIVSVERIKEYSETPAEGAWDIEETRPTAKWPNEGRVDFEDYATRYRPGLDLVLRGITFSIKSEEKVGIVGRTGAGKSSMTLSLFRIIESAHGSIIIDGIPIHILGLHQLRTKLTILPQDPVLFSGSLRMNLDPFDRHLDPELWEALEHAHLKPFVDSLPAQLEHECGEGGQNLSVGQRQLVCLARALLHKTKILVLDEATAAIDLETDELIQNTIRSEFASCTVITIAHRLNTIMASDRVMVLDAGNVIEFAEPQKLLKDKNTVFYSMAKNAGLVA
ncbi:Multidrug resistance-associated protein 1 [Lamellibrachia satsuma]|nr:Multidrug resistance-associated protein 1 [Lamellibrachia satsuma]